MVVHQNKTFDFFIYPAQANETDGVPRVGEIYFMRR